MGGRGKGELNSHWGESRTSIQSAKKKRRGEGGAKSSLTFWDGHLESGSAVAVGKIFHGKKERGKKQ